MPATYHPFDRNTLIHFRLIFSVFLFPVYLFGLSQTQDLNFFNTLIIFVALHFFIYPASNLYNSYWDKDIGSIGGLKHPPPVTKKLYHASIWLDVSGILLVFIVHPLLGLFLLPYICASKVYSWPVIRLKKYPVIGWLTVILFQGAYTFFLVNYFSTTDITTEWWNEKNMLAMTLSSLLIGAYYPLTQIYQHEEDSKRGDFTISYKLGIKGTFIFTIVLFSLSIVLAYYYFTLYYAFTHFLTFTFCLLPAILYFLWWFSLCVKNPQFADFKHAMRMTMISSICLILAFSILLLLNNRK